MPPRNALANLLPRATSPLSRLLACRPATLFLLALLTGLLHGLPAAPAQDGSAQREAAAGQAGADGDASPAPDIQLPPREKFHIYLLIGQSNMAGRGKVEPADREAHPRVLAFTKDRQWRPAVDPLHFDKPAVVGVGLGRTFGLEMAEADPEATIGLVPCAVGGSPIASWEPGGYHPQTKTHPYDDAFRRIEAALADGVLKGILWHQGESDSQPALARVYEEKLHALIARLRCQLDAPRVPFIAGQMGRFAERPWNEARKQVDQAHRDLPSKVPVTAFVSSEGLQHKGDQVHFDAASYRELGRRYARALRQLQTTRIGFGSCIRQDRPMPILETIADQRPDLFLFLGDNIYADTTDMGEMRAKYERLGNDPGFARLRKTCPVLATWDDHDFGQNDAGAAYSQREASQRIFLDFWNDPPDSPRRERPGVYAAHVFGPVGQRVQVILLDTRYFRGPLATGPRRTGGPYVPTSDTNVPLLGDAQWQWLEEQLRQPAEVRILVSSIQLVAEDAGQETWSNLPHERQRLLKLLDKTGARGLLVLSGDRHWAELSRLEQDVPYPLYDLTSSSLNQPHPRGTPTPNRFRALPTTYHRENYGMVQIDWRADDPMLTLQIRDVQGKVRLEHRLPLSQLRRAS